MGSQIAVPAQPAYGIESLIGKKVLVTLKTGEYAIGRLLMYGDPFVSVTDVEETNMAGWSERCTGFSTGIKSVRDISLYLPKMLPEDLYL